MENNFKYKWSKIFAAKRYNNKDGVITLTPLEQQELLDDSEKVDVEQILIDYETYLTFRLLGEKLDRTSKLLIKDYLISKNG